MIALITKERMVRILEILNERTFVSVNTLTELLHVSRSSIVRDLIELENQGLLQRERGGASLKSTTSTLSSYNEVAVFEKENIHLEEKRLICAEAAKSIRDGECVYIDSGTTPSFILDYLGNKKIKLVTPSIYLIRKLPANFPGDVFLLGGEFKQQYDMSYGPLTLDMIRPFRFDIAFMSTNGVDLETMSASVFDFSVGAVKKSIMERSKKCDLLIDSSKVGINSMCTWADLDDFHSIYVDQWDDSKEILDNVVVCSKK